MSGIRLYCGGVAYDFCLEQQTLGYIVVSREASERLERRYSVRDTCSGLRVGQAVLLNLETNTITSKASLDFSSSNNVSSKRSGTCKSPTDYFFRNGKWELCKGKANPRRKK